MGKIVIDESVLDKLEILIASYDRLSNKEEDKILKSVLIGKLDGLKEAKLILLENSTRISIDESIEDRAFKLINEINDYASGFSDYGLPIGNYELIKITNKALTEQSIISEIKSKEKCKHEPISLKGAFTSCSKCGMLLQLQP